MDQVRIIEAYSRLKALKEHVPGPHVHTKYVAEFHDILDLLQDGSGASLAAFRIAASEIKPVITSVTRWSRRRWWGSLVPRLIAQR